MSSVAIVAVIVGLILIAVVIIPRYLEIKNRKDPFEDANCVIGESEDEPNG